MKKKILPVAIAISLLVSCREPQKHGNGIHFTTLQSTATGVDFNNAITEDDSLNMFVNEYTYMGGGVGVADFNNDGLQDIFFAGNQVSSCLYLNKGNLRFENITKSAGIATQAWCTGVSIVDINNDGWQDIYVSVSDKTGGAKRKNLLFINQHNLTFKEFAAAYGIADSACSTQAVFTDYDKDGRLDMYLLNHTLGDNQPNNIRDVKVDTTSNAADKLYHNEGIAAGTDHPYFKDVTRQAGISEDGNGLGVVSSDYNGDGYPDLYVANDYIRNDVLWMNNGDGTFRNAIATATKHQSYSSMGTDAADLNNDSRPDLVTLDMQPEGSERKKMMYSFLNDQRHQLEMMKGYQPQYIHNMLQLNNGVRQVNNKQEPFFSEIGEMAGIAETDWSWSVLIADWDNDGWKDIHIGNGLGRDPTNIDFLEYRRNTVLQSGLPDNNAEQRKQVRAHLDSLGSLSLHNYLYRNKGDLTFEDISAAAGIDEKSISNGAIYADLDNDGDLDIITNNINSNAFILRNDADDTAYGLKNNHYLTVQLKGDSLNMAGIGAKVFSYSAGMAQMLEQSPVRGYLSSVDQRLHFGFGNRKADSLKVIWPDGKFQIVPHPVLDTILTLSYANAKEYIQVTKPATESFFTDITPVLGVGFTHKETPFYDYSFQLLLQQKYSQEGPFISTGDMNGDGLEDFFVGGAFKQSGKVFLQRPDGHFVGKDLTTATKNEEDMQSVLFDADGDKDLDLLIASGSSEFEITSSFYRPRLYLNDGKGNFHLDDAAISPLIRTPAKSLAIADMDGDGDEDVFIGGRVALGTYPQPPRSYLLRNDHGKFTDVTTTVCPALENPGLLNAAAWVDINNDAKPDLVIAGDWMPIRIFKNNGTTFTETTEATGLQALPGFWRTLQLADVDKDGDLDILAGNLGLNNPYHITKEQPAELVAKDFDNNGMVEPIICYYLKDNDGHYQLSSGISRDEWAMQMPSIKKEFDINIKYAAASMESVFTKERMDGAMLLHANEVRSGWFENDGKGRFTFHPFPQMTQIAPVNSIVFTDVNNDHNPDVVLAGNEYQSGVAAGGRYDASYGLVLSGTGKGKFSVVSPEASGLLLDGDTRDLKIVTVGKKKLLLAAINDAAIKAYSLTKISGK